jgi:hypothetical protein
MKAMEFALNRFDADDSCTAVFAAYRSFLLIILGRIYGNKYSNYVDPGAGSKCSF